MKALDIPWELIDKKWKFAAVNQYYDEKRVCFFERKPVFTALKDSRGFWKMPRDFSSQEVPNLILNLDIDEVLPAHSLSNRPPAPEGGDK